MDRLVDPVGNAIRPRYLHGAVAAAGGHQIIAARLGKDVQHAQLVVGVGAVGKKLLPGGFARLVDEKIVGGAVFMGLHHIARVGHKGKGDKIQ